jgi:hypothetical protein
LPRAANAGEPHDAATDFAAFNPDDAAPIRIVGGGIEGRIADNWTGKIEYLYLDLGAVTTIPTTPLSATTAIAFSSRVTDSLLRVGVNYKFDAIDIWAY